MEVRLVGCKPDGGQVMDEGFLNRWAAQARTAEPTAIAVLLRGATRAAMPAPTAISISPY